MLRKGHRAGVLSQAHRPGPQCVLSMLREALLFPTLGFLLPAVLHLRIHSDD